MRRLSAADALGRGAANVRANRELVLVSALGSIAIVALMVLSFLPWIPALGIDASWFSAEHPDPQKVVDAIEKLGDPAELLARLGGFLLAFAVASTLGSILFFWYQGGSLGVLVAGDAQAPAGGGREPILFRTWAGRFFVHEANRLTWRMCGFYTLFLTIWTLFGGLTVLLFAGAGLLGSHAGAGAGCAVACGILLPLVFVSFTLYAAMVLGQVDLVRPESRIGSATRGAFSILGRRLGAAIALFAILIVVGVGVGIGFAIVGLVSDLLLASHTVVHAIFRVVLGLFQMVASAAVGLVVNAAFVALARSEAALPEPE